MTATRPDPDRLWATASAALAGHVKFAVRHAPRTMTTVERMNYIAAAVDQYEADMERVESASRAVVQMAISHHAVYQNGATVVWLGVMSLKPEDGGSSTYSPMNFSAGQVCEHCWLADGSVQPVGFMGDSPYGCPHGGEQR